MCLLMAHLAKTEEVVEAPQKAMDAKKEMLKAGLECCCSHSISLKGRWYSLEA